MQKRAVVLTLLAALVFGFIASMAIYRFLQQKQHEIEQARGEVAQVVVAAADVPPGTTLTAEQLRTVMWPKASLPPGSANDSSLVIGRLTVRDLVAGEPILEAKLAPKDVTTGAMTFLIPPGKRAITVGVDQVSGVSGFILPNSYVDVIVTTTPPKGPKISQTVLQNMRVLAVGQIIDQKDGKPVPVPTVTIAVTPDEAERLAMASSEGLPRLVLRKFGDQEEVQTKGITISKLLLPPGMTPPPEKKRVAVRRPPPPPVVVEAPPPPPPPTHTVEVIRSGKGAVEKDKETFVQDKEGYWRKKGAQ
jgi:pilus assembly protein CpaB